MSTQKPFYQPPQVDIINFDAENSLCITGSGSGMPGFDPIELDLDF